MTSQTVLVVGSDLGTRVEEATAPTAGIAVEVVADEEAALYELAADAVDCVVASSAVLEGDSAFAGALAERPDVAAVTVPTAGRPSGQGTTIERTGDERGHEADGADELDLEGAIADAVGMTVPAASQTDETPAIAPLTLTIADGSIIGANGPPMSPLGHDPETLIGEEIATYVHPDDRETLAALLADDGEDASDVLRFEHYDGDWRRVRVDRRPTLPDRTRFDVYRREIEELPAWFPRGEDAEEILAVLYAHAPIHLYVKDAEGRHVWVSRYHAGNATETIGKRDIDFDWGEFGERTYEDDMAVLESGEPALNREEFVPFHEDWNLTSKEPWIEDGEVRGLVGVTWRITKRKEYEQRLKRENERLERFASIVSHDLRNPINVAMGNLELARESDDPEHLSRIERALQRMDRVTADVLTMAREGEWVTETEPVSLDRIARTAWDMVVTEDATLSVEADRSFEGDPNRLKHLFENLYRNAVEHGGEDVTVHVGPIEDEGFYVADDGVGMSVADADRAFETGQSTGDSTGLGLAIVREVAEAHGWEVSVSESDAGGACFEVTGLAPLD